MESKSNTHGQEMGTGCLQGPITEPEHCCICWRYTDDSTVYREIVQAANSLLHSDQHAAQQSQAWDDAAAFLSRVFQNTKPPRIG